MERLLKKQFLFLVRKVGLERGSFVEVFLQRKTSKKNLSPMKNISASRKELLF